MATQFRQMDTPSFPRLMIFGYYTLLHIFSGKSSQAFCGNVADKKYQLKERNNFGSPTQSSGEQKSLSQASPLSQAVFATKPARKSPTSQGQKTNRERALPPTALVAFLKRNPCFARVLIPNSADTDMYILIYELRVRT